MEHLNVTHGEVVRVVDELILCRSGSKRCGLYAGVRVLGSGGGRTFVVLATIAKVG